MIGIYKFPRKSVIFYKYILSYIVVLLFPLLILTYFINNNILSVFQEQINTSNIDNLMKAREQIEQKFKDMEKIAVSISTNPSLSPYMINKNYYRNAEGISNLRNYAYASDLFHDILYYVKGNDKVFTTYHASDLKMLLENIYPFEKWSYEQFYA